MNPDARGYDEAHEARTLRLNALRDWPTPHATDCRCLNCLDDIGGDEL